MSAILSADDLNDFISPGVACIKPVEIVPTIDSGTAQNPYEVQKDDDTANEKPPPAQISLTDCLACSGCVTSAEAVLVSLQSHAEVLSVLDQYESISDSSIRNFTSNPEVNIPSSRKVFVASVSPQSRASLAATFHISERRAGRVIESFLSGATGLKSGGKYGSGFSWVFDTSTARQACLALGDKELEGTNQDPILASKMASERTKKPILSSACPGWICYAEKTHPHVLPHLSRVKSPQALLGTMLKTTISKIFNIPPSQIWHLAVMPCFDKKLEASRLELTDSSWNATEASDPPVRDVDCVITTKELLMLADSRGIDLSAMKSEQPERLPFPDLQLETFFYPQSTKIRQSGSSENVGTSGGYLHYILKSHLEKYPGSYIQTQRGRNADVVEFSVLQDGQEILKTARFYGFRNIQNLVRKLRPPKVSRMPGARAGSKQPGRSGACDYAYVEVMACPGGCTNGGGQIKPTDRIAAEQHKPNHLSGPGELDPKAWLGKVDEAYFSGSSEDEADTESDGNISATALNGDRETSVASSAEATLALLKHWAALVDVDLDKLVFTSFREVESDVGKSKSTDTERVVALSSKAGGGW